MVRYSKDVDLLKWEPVLFVELAPTSQTSRAVMGRLLEAAAPAPILDRIHRLMGHHRERLRKRPPVLPGREVRTLP